MPILRSEALGEKTKKIRKDKKEEEKEKEAGEESSDAEAGPSNNVVDDTSAEDEHELTWTDIVRSNMFSFLSVLPFYDLFFTIIFAGSWDRR